MKFQNTRLCSNLVLYDIISITLFPSINTHSNLGREFTCGMIQPIGERHVEQNAGKGAPGDRASGLLATTTRAISSNENPGHREVQKKKVD